jgi:hypothetical protein
LGIPLGSPHRAEQDGVSVVTGRKRLGRQRLPRGVDRTAAKRELGKFKPVAKMGSAVLKHSYGNSNDFRTDAISRQQDNFFILNGHGSIFMSGELSTKKFLNLEKTIRNGQTV